MKNMGINISCGFKRWSEPKMGGGGRERGLRALGSHQFFVLIMSLIFYFKSACNIDLSRICTLQNDKFIIMRSILLIYIVKKNQG